MASMCGSGGTRSGQHDPIAGPAPRPEEEEEVRPFDESDFSRTQAQSQQNEPARSHGSQRMSVPGTPAGWSTNPHTHVPEHHRPHTHGLDHLNRPSHIRTTHHHDNIPPPPPPVYVYPGLMYVTHLQDGAYGYTFVRGHHILAPAAGLDDNMWRVYLTQEETAPSGANTTLYSQTLAQPTHGGIPQHLRVPEAGPGWQPARRNVAERPAPQGLYGGQNSRYGAYAGSTTGLDSPQTLLTTPETPIMPAAELRNSRAEREQLREQRRERRTRRRPSTFHGSRYRNPGDPWSAWGIRLDDYGRNSTTW